MIRQIIYHHGTVEFSPNNVLWEVYDSASFMNLSSSAIKSTVYSSIARNFLRVRAVSSGSVGSNTGSLDVFANLNIF